MRAELDERLFLVTSRHVMIDEPSNHFPDRIEIELHIDPDNMARPSMALAVVLSELLDTARSVLSIASSRTV